MSPKWDPSRLGRVLTVFVHEGRVSEDAARMALRSGRVDRLLKSPALNPYDREILDQCQRRGA